MKKLFLLLVVLFALSCTKDSIKDEPIQLVDFEQFDCYGDSLNEQGKTTNDYSDQEIIDFDNSITNRTSGATVICRSHDYPYPAILMRDTGEFVMVHHQNGMLTYTEQTASQAMRACRNWHLN